MGNDIREYVAKGNYWIRNGKKVWGILHPDIFGFSITATGYPDGTILRTNTTTNKFEIIKPEIAPDGEIQD